MANVGARQKRCAGTTTPVAGAQVRKRAGRDAAPRGAVGFLDLIANKWARLIAKQLVKTLARL